MMKNIVNAVERLRKRFDLNAQKKDEAKAQNMAHAKRPPKRKSRR